MKMVSTVAISRDLLEAIRADALRIAGVEGCGLLFGTAGRIDAFQPAANVATDPATRFEIDPAALIQAHRRARGGGATMVGHYHSHPTGRAWPSAADAADAAPDGSLWLILAASGEALFRAAAGGPVHGIFLPLSLNVTS